MKSGKYIHERRTKIDRWSCVAINVCLSKYRSRSLLAALLLSLAAAGAGPSPINNGIELHTSLNIKYWSFYIT